MSDIADQFFRESFFTKIHEPDGSADHNNNSEKNTSTNENNLFELKNIQSNENNSKNINPSSKKNYNEEPELFSAVVETIIPIDDKLKNDAIYNIKIQSSLNCNDSWIKQCTLNELIKFRDYLITYIHSVINLPFPSKSLFRFLPYIGRKYDERNWDILLENKFLLDDFLFTICSDKEMYKLTGFISFFSKPSNYRFSIFSNN